MYQSALVCLSVSCLFTFHFLLYCIWATCWFQLLYSSFLCFLCKKKSHCETTENVSQTFTQTTLEPWNNCSHFFTPLHTHTHTHQCFYSPAWWWWRTLSLWRTWSSAAAKDQSGTWCWKHIRKNIKHKKNKTFDFPGWNEVLKVTGDTDFHH